MTRILLLLSVICFAIGAVRSGFAGVDWQSAGFAFAVASLVAGEL